MLFCPVYRKYNYDYILQNDLFLIVNNEKQQGRF